MRRLLPLVLFLSACTPAEVLKAGEKLLALGRTADACEVYQRGQAHFPRNADIAAAAGTTCPAALASLADSVTGALSRGDIAAARTSTDRMRQLFAGSPQTRQAERAVVDAWSTKAASSFARGDDAHTVSITRDMLNWSSLANGFRDQLLVDAADRALDIARGGDFPSAQASLNAFTALGDPTGVIRGARGQLNGMEAGVLSLRAEQTAGSDLATAWMLARAAAARDGQHGGLVQRIESQWRAQNALGLAFSVSDPNARPLMDGVAASTRTDLVQWTDPRSAALTVRVHSLVHQCHDQVQNIAANHVYVAGYRDLPNPTWVALDREADSLARDRDRARRDLHVAEGALGPSRAAVAQAESHVARLQADRSTVKVRRDQARDRKNAKKQILDTALAALEELQEQQQASRDQETRWDAAQTHAKEARQQFVRLQEAARSARDGRSPAAAERACAEATHEREVAACADWDRARRSMEQGRVVAEAAESNLEELRNTPRIEVRPGDIQATRRAVEQARVNLAHANGELDGFQETLNTHDGRVRAAERDVAAAADGLRGAEQASRNARDQVNGLERRLQGTLARRDAMPAVLTEAIEAVQPYVIERWTRTCTADIAGDLTADGGRLPLREQTTLSMTDDTWRPMPAVGLPGDALLFRMNPGQAYAALDATLATQVQRQVDDTLSGMLAARSNAGPHTSEADALLMGMFAGLRGEHELTAYAERTLGAGW